MMAMIVAPIAIRKWSGEKNKRIEWFTLELQLQRPPFKDSTKMLNDTGKKSEPIYKKLFNTLWQQKEPLDKLKDEMSIKLLNAWN